MVDKEIGNGIGSSSSMEGVLAITTLTLLSMVDKEIGNRIADRRSVTRKDEEGIRHEPHSRPIKKRDQKDYATS